MPAEIYFLQWTSWQLTVSMQFSNQSWGLFYFASIYPTDQFLDVFLWPWKCKYIQHYNSVKAQCGFHTRENSILTVMRESASTFS